MSDKRKKGKENKEDRFEYRKVYNERVVKSEKKYNKNKVKKKSKFIEDFIEEEDI